MVRKRAETETLQLRAWTSREQGLEHPLPIVQGVVETRPRLAPSSATKVKIGKDGQGASWKRYEDALAERWAQIQITA